ncbi:MAG: DUF4160 domain-containing protein [Prevotellaceae bacterium]|nr:DUF4160 domain-containing protein [Prevotellaceae bacterium]
MYYAPKELNPPHIHVRYQGKNPLWISIFKLKCYVHRC